MAFDLPLISREDKDKISDLVNELFALKFNQDRLMERMLDGLLDFIPAKATCSLLQCNRFFSELDVNGEKGKCLNIIHRNPPPNLILKRWESLTKRSISNIEEALYAKRTNERYGYARLHDLIPKEEWKKTRLAFIAKMAGIQDLAYLWIRCAPDDLWIVCFRRKKDEAAFSLYDLAMLEEFGGAFYRYRATWYLSKMRILSKKQRQIVALLYERKTADEIAQILKITLQTYDTHLKNIRKKLNSHNLLEIFLTLENR